MKTLAHRMAGDVLPRPRQLGSWLRPPLCLLLFLNGFNIQALQSACTNIRTRVWRAVSQRSAGVGLI